MAQAEPMDTRGTREPSATSSSLACSNSARRLLTSISTAASCSSLSITGLAYPMTLKAPILRSLSLECATEDSV